MKFKVGITTKDFKIFIFICDRVYVNKTSIRFNLGLQRIYFYKSQIVKLEIKGLKL